VLRRNTAFLRIFVLGALPWALSPAAAEKELGVCIETRLVSRGPDGKEDVTPISKMTAPFGRQMMQMLSLPAPPAKGGKAPPQLNAGPWHNTRLEIAPHSLGDGLVLVGRFTISDILEIVKSGPPNEAPDASCTTVRTVVTPLALALIPGDDFVAVPMAKRGDNDRKYEIQFRTTLVEVVPTPPAHQRLIAIECQFVERGPDGKANVLSFPKVTTTPGKRAILRMAEERHFAKGTVPEGLGDAEESEWAAVDIGTIVEVSPAEREGGFFLTGHATITELIDQISTAPPNEAPATSYTTQQVFAPFALTCPADGEYVTLPMAKWGSGGKNLELRLRATTIDAPAPPPRPEPKRIDWGKE
jgi:hypothetical protein